MRAQSSVEVIIILAGVLIVLAFIYAASQEQLTQSGNQVRVSQARLSVALLASAAQEAYSEGPGSVRTVSVTIPEGNVGSRTGVFNQSMINIGLYVGNSTSDINEMVPFVLVQGANFPTQPGTYSVNVRSFEGYVMLGDPGYAISPGVIALQMLANASAPRRIIHGTIARVSTLLMSVGLPHKPDCAGNGGRKRGIPRRTSTDAIRAVSSPQTKAPAPSLMETRNG
jgi:hypothetical protein